MYIYVNILDISIENIRGSFLKLCAIATFYRAITILKCHLFKTQIHVLSPFFHSNTMLEHWGFFRKRLSENEARRYINQMTSALNYMHSQNFLHRDIKLENTVLQSGGKVFIVGEYVRSGFGAMTRKLKYVSVEILKYTVKQEINFGVYFCFILGNKCFTNHYSVKTY